MHFHMHLVVNHIIHIFVCNYTLYLLSTTYLRATPYLPVNSVKVMRFSLPMPAFLVFWLPLIVWLLKFDFGVTLAPKINLVLSMISIITKIVKLLHMIWIYVTSIVVCQSLSLSVSLTDMHFASSWIHVAYTSFCET